MPKKIRFLIWNIKCLKKFKTKTGIYYLPFFAFKDRIRNKIIDNQISDEKVYKELKNYIKEDTIILDVGANYGQMSIYCGRNTNPELKFMLLRPLTIFLIF